MIVNVIIDRRNNEAFAVTNTRKLNLLVEELWDSYCYDWYMDFYDVDNFGTPADLQEDYYKYREQFKTWILDYAASDALEECEMIEVEM